MDVQFLNQGLNPEGASAGNFLIENLGNTAYNKFTAFVAFAGVSGLRKLRSHIRNAKDYIDSWNIFVGIDIKGTSKEALELLLEININTRIYYTKTQITYHPKVYIFEGEESNKIMLGSSNLTERGLFNNIESNIVLEFESTDEQGMEVLGQLKRYFGDFLDDTNSNIRLLTQELIDLLYERNIIPTEEERRRKYHDTNSRDEGDDNGYDEIDRISELFPSITMQRTPRVPNQRQVDREGDVEIHQADDPEDLWNNKGDEVWVKRNLRNSDAQIVTVDGTNPTGVLRLAQARYRKNGELIDKNTYFRDTLFGDFDWTERRRRNNPPLQETNIRFRMRIGGDDKGEFILRISHDPDRIADQANIPTTLHWGDAIDVIRRNNVVGKDLYLYAPPDGASEPFFIDIRN